jgi:cytochrome P450
MTETSAHCPIQMHELPAATDRAKAWEIVRSNGAVFRSGDDWYVTSAAACRFVTRNPQLFSSATHGDTLNAPSPYIPGGIDPPEHLGYRQVIDRKFAPKVLGGMEEGLRARLNELIDAFAATGRCEIMADLAQVFPAEVFMQIFGLPLDDRVMLADWVHTTLVGAYSDDGVVRARSAKENLQRYLEDLFEQRRNEPRDDFISYVLGQGWSDAEVMGTAFNVVQGGLDTMTGAIGLIFYHLAAQPDLQRRVREDSELIDPTVEEILRIDTPVPFSNRTATQDVELEGSIIPAGAHVFVAYGAANSDPEAFACPASVDLDQQNRRDIFTFGGGTHRCLGSHLARRELRLILEEFHRRIPFYELEHGYEHNVRWPSVVMSPDRVPLVFPIGEA